MSEKDKTTIQFNKSAEEILNEKHALTPEQEAARARMASLKAPRAPIGGAPAVKIPPLDAQHIDGRTMQDQAAVLTDPTNPLSPSYNPELAAMTAERRPASNPQGGPLAPLPPGAQYHPSFRPGVGAMYAANQPSIKVTEEPDAPYKPKLRPETLESIKALENFRMTAETQQNKEVDAKKDETKKVETEKVSKTPFDDFDYKMLREFQDKEDWNILNNPKRRKEIESQLKPMRVEDIIIHGEVRQDVPVAPNVLVTYRSVGGDEDLAIKQMMFGEKGGDRYIYDKYTIMQLTLGIVAVNNYPLPSHLDSNGDLNEKMFLEKFKKLSKFPLQFLANLGVNYAWFDERVRMLFLSESEELKNG